MRLGWWAVTHERREKRNTTTHQLNKRQSSVAVGHDEDILGFGFGHKVVPHVHHVFLGGSVFLQQHSNVFMSNNPPPPQKTTDTKPPESEGRRYITKKQRSSNRLKMYFLDNEISIALLNHIRGHNLSPADRKGIKEKQKETRPGVFSIKSHNSGDQ